jgi:2-dehydropantoate 2-reductase
VLLLTTKTQHTAGLVEQIAPMSVGGSTAGDVLPLVSAQNGVASERLALRRFANVYGVCVQLPATHLEPGVVVSHGQPRPGILPVGRFPGGVDATAEGVSAAFRDAGFESEARADVMRWKHAKLLANLSNGTRVAMSRPEGDAQTSAAAEVGAIVRAEGEAALDAAGIPWTSEEEFRGDRGGLAQTSRKDAGASSTWQSLARGAGSTEVDYLNGEIVLLGRLHGVATPANVLVQRIVNELTIAGAQPGALAPTELLAMIRAVSTT